MPEPRSISPPAARWTIVMWGADQASADGWVGVAPAAGWWVEVRDGWPEEYERGPRCQFCGDRYPTWAYLGVEV
ncbi:hypothetical protein [Frankia sp. AiPa1]|uniref:hypothetical protein n=1 Tax=Frankia sp. AiPa1 TaxID=573492 RepID=UPI00202B4FA1|nr:hypothetical protein [Frankia sp. AiPa1]MCL9762964.1 hypothetical protein [Frankia sp. AiPa1]